MTRARNLKEVAWVFFKLGCIAFGGPAAHIAMMEAEVVQKRQWMDRQHFLDLVGATNLIPGPNSTEMTMHCGRERAGIPGLFVAGLSFIFPAVCITGVIAWFYVQYGQLPEVQPFIYGIQPAVLAIIASAIFKLGQKALKNREIGILGALVIFASLLGINEIAALLGAGILGTVYFSIRHRSGTVNRQARLPFVLLQASVGWLGKTSSLSVFWTFLKVGAVLYGSGYVLFAYLDAELVARGWLTRQQLMEAIAVGQFTPGPVLSTATFIGYQLNGLSGAFLATAGIFLPSFLFVWALNPLVPRMRSSRILAWFLDCVNMAAVGVMAAVLVKMTAAALVSWQTILIAVISTAITLGSKKVSPVWIVAGGAALGYLLQLL
ncbi:MAG: chromate efflux transporter [Bacteroidetes bacterium]|nr:MAG: chromate efflux transporter [Bacteroidota bacterium]